METEEKEGKGEGHEKAGKKMRRWRKRKKLIEEERERGGKEGRSPPQ